MLFTSVCSYPNNVYENIVSDNESGNFLLKKKIFKLLFLSLK